MLTTIFIILSAWLCSYVNGFRPHGLLVYRLCFPPDTPIIFISNYYYQFIKRGRHTQKAKPVQGVLLQE